jgi:hypothetical protein
MDKKENLQNEEEYSPYCPICDSCGEDGCCPATACKQHNDGKYCKTYLKELQFGYLMYHKIFKMVENDSKYEDQINDVFSELWDKIFLEKNENN